MMRRLWRIALLITLVIVTTIVAAPGAWADTGQPVPNPPGLQFFTPYPAQETAIGESVTFPLTLRTGDTPEIVHLDLQDLPKDWTATFRGGGRIVEAAYVDPKNDTSLELRVEPPKDVAPGNYRFTVMAQDEAGQQISLPIELIVKEKLPPRLTLSVDLPTLRGTPDTTFRYNATLKNEGDEDLSVNLASDAPKGVQVSFKLTGQDVTSIPLAASETKHISVEAKVFPDMPAGSYPINVLAQGGDTQATTALTAEVAGQSDLTVTAPDGRLSGQAYVGTTTPIKLVVQNNGSAAAHNVEFNASQPAGWKVAFDPKRVDEIPSGQQVEVTVSIQPADQAVAGDYVVTVRANSDDSPARSADFRITVLTSTLWGLVGIGLIAVAVLVVGVAVMRFGRR